MSEKKTKKTETPYWRASKSNGRKKTNGKGKYDKRNPLNELTGKEWLYFTNSVWITAFPPTAGKDSGFDLRKIHPSPKPPELMKDIIAFFTKRNQLILDPFAGVGGTLIGASILEHPRKVVGIELNQDYVSAYENVCKELEIKPQKMICDDARNMLKHSAVNRKTFDLILTDPPYCNMMAQKKNGQKKKLYGKNDASKYNESLDDIGNLGYDDFLNELRDILALAVKKLKVKGYLVVFCKDLQPNHVPNLLHADMINKIIEIEGMRYRGMRIWHDQATDLYPFGYPFAFVMNQMHQYILIFRKEK